MAKQPRLDWSSMESSILSTIFEFLPDSDPQRRRIAAVCPNWRRSISLLPAAPDHTFIVPVKLPKTRSSLKSYTFYIISSSVSSRVWLIRVQQPESNKWVLHDPFTSSLSSRPFTLNLLGNFRIHQAAKSHQLYKVRRKKIKSSPYSKKVIVISKFALVLFLDGKLSFTYEDEWIDFETNTMYKDIVSFNDEFYAIDVEGFLIKFAMEIDNNTKPKLMPVLITSRVGFRSNETPYLVTSSGNLYMIIKEVEKRVGYNEEVIVDCTAYVLKNKQIPMWESVSSLKNMVFFLLEGVSFSVPGIDLGYNRGNFIYLLHNYVEGKTERDFIWVYDLNDSKITTDFKDVPRPFFWPPPNWVTTFNYVLSLLL